MTVNGHAATLPPQTHGPFVRPWEPDDIDLPAGSFEFRLLECAQHGTCSFFRRYRESSPHACLPCYVADRREVYVQAEAGQKVVVETMDRQAIAAIDVPFVPPLQPTERRVRVAFGKRVVIETRERRGVRTIDVNAPEPATGEQENG